jgi:hypothetical protein
MLYAVLIEIVANDHVQKVEDANLSAMNRARFCFECFHCFLLYVLELSAETCHFCIRACKRLPEAHSF